jgi:hypothetical protein
VGSAGLTCGASAVAFGFFAQPVELLRVRRLVITGFVHEPRFWLSFRKLNQNHFREISERVDRQLLSKPIEKTLLLNVNEAA